MSRTVKLNDNRSVTIVTSESTDTVISKNDAEMDARARQAVKAAVSKAEFCKKPIAKYDKTNKKAYIEYADGEKRYVK